MPKRGSRRLAKKASGRRPQRQSAPNVFVADPQAVKEPREPGSAPPPPEPAPTNSAAAPAQPARPGRPATRSRVARGERVRARSEVFSHYLPQELRKIGVLSAGVLVALIVLTVLLG